MDIEASLWQWNQQSMELFFYGNYCRIGQAQMIWNRLVSSIIRILLMEMLVQKIITVIGIIQFLDPENQNPEDIVDKDDDGMPDYWELQYSTIWTNNWTMTMTKMVAVITMNM